MLLKQRMIWKCKGVKIEFSNGNTCYSASGEKFEEKVKLEKDTLDIFKQFGKEKIENMFDDYVNERSEKSYYPKANEYLNNLKKELLERIQIENVVEAEDDMEM